MKSIFQKCRGFHGNGAQPFEARYEVRNGSALWTRSEIADVERARVVAAIKEGMSVRDAAEELGMSKSKGRPLEAEGHGTRRVLRNRRA